MIVVAAVLVRHLGKAWAPRPSAAECSALVERYVQHESRQRFPNLDERAIEEALHTSEAAAALPRDVHACQQGLTAEQVRCGLGAPNIAAFERCIQ